MNKMRGFRMHRSSSLPTSSLTPTTFRGIPEGSETFKKALEELYANEPNHAPSSNNKQSAALNEISEANESEFVESEDELNEQSDEDLDVIEINRRHSTPLLPEKNGQNQSSSDKSALMKKFQNSVRRSQTRYTRDYFIKHGGWPNVDTAKLAVQRNASARKLVNKSLDRRNSQSSKTTGTYAAKHSI